MEQSSCTPQLDLAPERHADPLQYTHRARIPRPRQPDHMLGLQFLERESQRRPGHLGREALAPLGRMQMVAEIQGIGEPVAGLGIGDTAEADDPVIERL